MDGCVLRLHYSDDGRDVEILNLGRSPTFFLSFEKDYSGQFGVRADWRRSTVRLRKLELFRQSASARSMEYLANFTTQIFVFCKGGSDSRLCEDVKSSSIKVVVLGSSISRASDLRVGARQ
jgi:hypothetical protein